MYNCVLQRQSDILDKIKVGYNPLQCFQTFEMSSHDFDSIWQYEFVGGKYEEIKDPLLTGVLNTNKSYFIVALKSKNLAIFLWRGKE